MKTHELTPKWTIPTPSAVDIAAELLAEAQFRFGDLARELERATEASKSINLIGLPPERMAELVCNFAIAKGLAALHRPDVITAIKALEAERTTVLDSKEILAVAQTCVPEAFIVRLI